MKNTSPRIICISVSKKNRPTLDLIDDYALEFNKDKANTIFSIIREFNRMRIQELSTRK